MLFLCLADWIRKSKVKMQNGKLHPPSVNLRRTSIKIEKGFLEGIKKRAGVFKEKRRKL